MKQQHHKERKALSVKRYSYFKELITHNGSRNTQYGYTFVELMIAIAIGIIIIGATYAAYISQQRSFTAQDQVAEMNSTSKIALDMIANDIRETGFGVPEAGTYDINGFQQVITFTDNSALSDQVTFLGGFRRAGTLCSNGAGGDIGPGDIQLILRRRADSSQWNIDEGDRRNISIAGISFGVIAIGGGPGKGVVRKTITLQSPIGKAYPRFTDANGNGNCDDGEGAPVYVVEDTTYCLDSDGAPPFCDNPLGTAFLMRIRRLNSLFPATDVIAENIGDLQFAMVDINGDGITDRIRVNILARTARPDPNFQGQGNQQGMTIENRNHPATNDSFRRRWWQMEVDLRNPI